MPPPGILLALALAQPVPAEADAAHLERIRRALAETPPSLLSAPAQREGFVFRVTVRAPRAGPPIWEESSAVPWYIRPRYPGYHYDFLAQVTPEDFRAGTLYTVGLPIGSMIEYLGKQISIGRRKSREARAREEVAAALAELERERAGLNDAAPADQAPEVRRVTLKSGVEVQTLRIQMSGPKDKREKFVQDDFTIYEDGVLKPIALFVKNTDDAKRTRYEIGYVATPGPPGQKRRIDLRIRGVRKQISHEFSR
jgi:hypothetical protein